MKSMEHRRQRAVNGSRRKRDLEAGIDWSAWIAEHFPDEPYGYVLMHAQRLYCRQEPHRATMPAPEEVHARMKQFGHTKAQFEAKFSVSRTPTRKER